MLRPCEGDHLARHLRIGCVNVPALEIIGARYIVPAWSNNDRDAPQICIPNKSCSLINHLTSLLNFLSGAHPPLTSFIAHGFSELDLPLRDQILSNLIQVLIDDIA